MQEGLQLLLSNAEPLPLHVVPVQHRGESGRSGLSRDAILSSVSAHGVTPSGLR